jgi:general secretion pathway protein F
MPAFEYKALDAAGKNKSGVLEADNARQVRQQLREKSLIPLEVKVVEEQKLSEKSVKSFFTPSISVTDLALLTRQLSTLIEASLPIEEALLAVAEQSEKASTKNMMMAVRSKVVEGHSLAKALGEFPKAFDRLFTAMVAAGEKSGHLDAVLTRLADYAERRHQTQSQITQALVYPVLMTVVALGVVIMLLTTVVPKIIGQFDDMDQQLPGVTKVLIAISEAVQNYGILGLIVIVALIIAFSRMLKNPVLELKWHKRLLKLPFVGKLARGTNTARFARTLSILTSSSVPLLESMKIGGNVLENRHLQNLVKTAADRVKEGSSLRAALDQTRVFPPMMMHMIASGERSGELTQMLARAAENQEREFESTINMSLKIFEPVLIVTMAMMVLFIVMAIILPILELNNLAGI